MCVYLRWIFYQTRSHRPVGTYVSWTLPCRVLSPPTPQWGSARSRITTIDRRRRQTTPLPTLRSVEEDLSTHADNDHCFKLPWPRTRWSCGGLTHLFILTCCFDSRAKCANCDAKNAAYCWHFLFCSLFNVFLLCCEFFISVWSKKCYRFF